jgi:hypothetical protein
MPATVPDYVVMPDGLSLLEQIRLVEAVGPVLPVAGPVVHEPEPEPPLFEGLTWGPQKRRSFGPRELVVKGAAARRKDDA